MATVNQMKKTGGEDYTWSGFVEVQASTPDVWEEFAIPNELASKVRPEWVRVQKVVMEDEGSLIPPNPGIEVHGVVDITVTGPEWKIEDDPTAGTNAVRLAIFEAGAVSPVLLFVEYGVRHSVSR